MQNDMLVFKNKFKSLNDMFNLDNKTSFIAGPCTIESLVQLEKIALTLVECNVKFMRGGAYKPRTSPYDFQGLELEGLIMLDKIRKQYGLLVVSEITDVRDIEHGLMYTDIIQVGSRNMSNYVLLNELGKTNHPVLLKRGMMSTIDEFLLAAEYIVNRGNNNIILCERGIRTFETSTRNTLDVSCIALIKHKTSIPIIADISHSLGRKDIALPITKSLLALGADGIMLEVHPNPPQAKSDNAQQFDLDEFKRFMTLIND